MNETVRTIICDNYMSLYVLTEWIAPCMDQYHHLASSIRLSPCQTLGQVTADSEDVGGAISVCVHAPGQVHKYFNACKCGHMYYIPSFIYQEFTRRFMRDTFTRHYFMGVGVPGLASRVPIARNFWYIQWGCGWCVAGRLLTARDAGTRRALKGKARAISFKREM